MFFLPFLGFLSILTKADEPAYGTTEGIGAPAEVKASTFINEHKIPISKYTTTGDLPNYPFSNALGDSLDNRYWVGSIETTDTDKNIVELEFDDLQIVGSILYYVPFRTSGSIRHFDGFPTILNIYSKVNDTYPYELKYTVNNQPSYPSSFDSVIIQFPRRIICRKLKLEFVEVTEDRSVTSTGKRYAEIRELFIFKNTTENPYFPAQKATGSFSSSSNAIGKSECTTFTAGDQANRGKDLVFGAGNFWAGSVLNTPTFKNYFIFELNEMTSIESIDYGLAYSTSKAAPWTRRYDGYPIVLNIYTSSGNKLRNEPNYIYYGLPLINASDNKADLWDAIHIQFPKPIWCTRIKLEFEELTIDYSFGSKLTPSAQYIFLRKTPSDQIDPPDERIDAENVESNPRSLTISNTNFNDFQNTHDYGGAVHVININTQITQVTFTRCTSNIAGGAIYIDTKVSTEHQNSLEGLEFNNCGSQSGGAVCIIATFENDFTSIVDCTFSDNTATQGSAIYLAAKHGQVRKCRFRTNTGSSIIKYASGPPASTARLLTSSDFEISDCLFDTEIKEGSFYIEVDEPLDSISLKDNKFKSNDTQQTIKINQSPVKQETKSKSSLLLTILVPTLCVISLLLIVFIIVAHKNKDQQSEQEENHNEELTQDEV